MRWQRRQSEEDFRQEIDAHISLETDRLIAEGLSPFDARHVAVRRFGNITATRERFYESHRVIWLDDLWRDVTYAVRTLRRAPGFATAAILTLALGIGATTAVYSVVNTILLQALPFPNSDRLVRIVENFTGTVPGRLFQRGVTHQEFLEWRARAATLSDAAAVRPFGQLTMRTSNGWAGLWGASVSGNAFSLLGARAMLGRTLVEADEANPGAVVLSFDTWQRHFNADPGIVGTAVELRTRLPQLLTVVGVLPADFEFPTGPLDFYLSLAPNPSIPSPRATMIAHLQPDVPLKAAIDEANRIGAAITPPRPASAPPLPGPRFEVLQLKDQIVGPLRPALRVLLAAVGMVLLIVCVNVANLSLARGTARLREIAVRLAIGASRGRIVRQVMTECLVLAIAGGTLGTLIGAAGVALVKQLATVEAPGIFRLMFGATILPRAHEVGVDFAVLGIAFSIAAVTGVACGVLPALQLSRTSHMQAMGSRRDGTGWRESRIRAALVVGQLVMATVLLIGAGLLIHSFLKLSTVNKGYDPSDVLALQLLVPGQYSTARRAETIETLLARLRQIPNVRSAGFSRHGMLIGEELMIGNFVPPGRTLAEMRNDPARPRVRSVSDGFLTAMGVPLLDGREFGTGDVATAPPVIVISRSAARRNFGTDSPVGQFVDWYVDETPIQMRVVGVVEDVRQESLADETYPEVYVNYRQLLFLMERWSEHTERQNEWAIGFLSFAIRTSGDPASAVPTIRQLVTAVDPNIGIDALVPMNRLVANSVARQRFYAVMLGVFGGVAGLLGAIGVYGVLAYSVIQRTQELGIRMALGAQRAQVLLLVLRKGLILTTIGIVLGLVGAAVGTRLLQSMLFGITPLDAPTFIAVSLMFGLVAAVASYVPARRATRVDPLVALRCE